MVKTATFACQKDLGINPVTIKFKNNYEFLIDK